MSETKSDPTIIDLALIPRALHAPITALCRVGRDLSRRIARGPLGGSLGHEVGANSGGDGQKALDVMADDAFAAALEGTGVRWHLPVGDPPWFHLGDDGWIVGSGHENACVL